MADEPVLYREEAVQVVLAVHDILEVLHEILRALEDGGEGEEESGGARGARRADRG
jgi:hypothetical protein